jgi:hypothetical protein
VAREGNFMKAHEETLSLAVTTAEIAWPIILGMCIALMVLPFVFLLVVKRGSAYDDSSS